MERIYFVESPAQRRAPSTSAVAIHRAHLSHYISQLSGLEREQQRLSLEQQLLARQQAQLAAKRDQLTYLIAEEQDLVLRAIQQQQQQQQRQREEEAAALTAALAEREALIARRQKLRYAVYRKQQEEKALKDAEIQRVLQLVQQQAQRSELASPQQAYPALAQIETQRESRTSPDGSDSEKEETGVKPGSISALLRQQGIQPHDIYSSYTTPHSNRKRGSRRGPQQTIAPPISRLQAQEQAKAASSKLVPDVNYESAQDFLSALFRGLDESRSEPAKFVPKKPKPAGSKLEESSTTPLSVDELAKLLFSSSEPDSDVAGQVSELRGQQEPQEPQASRPPFHYTLSRSSIPRPESSTLSAVSSVLEAIASQIANIREKVKKAAAGIDSISPDLPESKRRQALLDIQVDLERCYSDLDDILITPAEGEEEDEQTIEQRQNLRLQKHAVTTLAVDTADRIDKILSPASRSDSEIEEEEEEEEVEEEYEVVPPVPAVLQAELGTSSSSSSKSTSVFVSEMPRSKTKYGKSEPASEEFYEVQEDDDTSVIVTASTPVSHDETAAEVFVPEGADAAGHIVLEKNTGQEVDEFLDSEEKSEVQVNLSVGDARKSMTDKVKNAAQPRSQSPLRHVVLEDVADDGE
ncbi:hypothetical protein V1525DRAFT_411005 [Lipomyces kononenkoae]|uniref:Uncharacterized protein n=1 Tax=Lipomyces kononenkoae TaxID=34357 RepID=A0ACC3STY8_LIPKO